MKHGTFSYGMTPKDVLIKAIGGERYAMTLRGYEAAMMVGIVNQGIDAHLEGFTYLKFSGNKKCLFCDVGPKDMLVLLRRLEESSHDEAISLRSGILSTLEIEEV